MAYGLRIWDANSNLTLDTTDRITRYHSTISLGTIAANATTSYNVPGLTTDGTWFLVLNGSLRNIYMYITANNLNFQNLQGFSINLTGLTVEIFRG